MRQTNVGSLQTGLFSTADHSPQGDNPSPHNILVAGTLSSFNQCSNLSRVTSTPRGLTGLLLDLLLAFVCDLPVNKFFYSVISRV